MVLGHFLTSLRFCGSQKAKKNLEEERKKFSCQKKNKFNPANIPSVRVTDNDYKLGLK